MLKIGGIYTSDNMIKGKRAAIIIIDKHPFCVSYYELPILSYYTRDDIEMILKDEKLFEKYADVTVCEDGLELEETIEKVLASLN